MFKSQAQRPAITARGIYSLKLKVSKWLLVWKCEDTELGAFRKWSKERDSHFTNPDFNLLLYIKYAYFFGKFKGYFSYLWKCSGRHLPGHCSELQEWGYSRGTLSWEPRAPPEQQGGNPHNQSTGEQSKALEATSPADTSSDRGKVTSEKASRSVQERQMEI